MNPEIQQIIELLGQRDTYAIFAGFAAFLQTGVEASDDVDIFLPSFETVYHLEDVCKMKGWTTIRTFTDEKYYLVKNMEKNGTTFDIIFSYTAKRSIFPFREQVEYNGLKLWTLTKEALLLTKMNQLSNPKRSDEKLHRDQKVIEILREQVDVDKLRKVLEASSDEFWVRGQL